MHRRCIALAAVLLATTTVAHAQVATTRMAEVALHDKTVERVERGDLQVPERHARPSGRRITIPFYRLRSSAAEPAAPIFLLAGGPGSSWLDQFEAEETHREAMFYRTI